MPLWPSRQLPLVCFPDVPEHIGLPWDAADDYVLALSACRPQSTLVFNDRHGALACALPGCFGWLESASAAEAIQRNTLHNQLAAPQWVGSSNELVAVSSVITDVIIRIPKNLEQLKHWLSLCAHLPESVTIWLAGMSKHIPVSWLQWLQANSQDYCQHPQQKKARVISLRSPKPLPDSTVWRGYEYQGLSLQGLPGVFCRDRLDPGAALMLETLAGLTVQPDAAVCDLGCGNGVLGLTLARQQPLGKLTLVDESLVAIQSARHNAQANQVVCENGSNSDPESDSAGINFHHGFSLQGINAQFDLILCNPPFHDGHRQLDNIARQMFSDSARSLTSGGELRVVANRHLAYRPALQKLFGTVDMVASNSKFIVWRCQNPGRPHA